MKPCCNPVPAHTPSLFTAIRWPKATTPKRQQILDTLDQVIDWPELESIARPFYASDVTKTGRKGYSLKMLLRCSVLQVFWMMSDRQLENTILDSHAFARFIGTDAFAPRPPSASVIRSFRKTMTEAEVDVCESAADRILASISRNLRNAGMEYRAGAVTDPVFKRTNGNAHVD